MAKSQERAAAPEPYVRIQEGKKIDEFATWRYHSILEALGWHNIGSKKAEEITTWICRQAKPGDEKEIENVKITIFLKEGGPS